MPYFSAINPTPCRKYVPRSTRSRNVNQSRNQRSTTLGFRFLQLLLARLGHLCGDFGRRVLVDMELHPIRPAAVCDRMQRGSVPIELGLGNERLHLRESSILLSTDDVPAPRG